ncbi:MAG: heme exporter protein CcmB [Acidobacteria bacterium]|nr:heme exporter protein CcmB [Acidobacteriota bacterium]MBI3278848.1 heme exporter protein CcmB [Acidobacteriota bacterium]
MKIVRQVFTVAAKDLRSEIRTKDTLNASLSFALVILLLFSFAFDPTAEQTREISGGLLWLVFAFAGALILNRSFSRELPNDCLEALIASPVPGSALFLGKTIANVLLLLTLELVCFPVFGIFYNVPWTEQFWPLMLVVVLATWGLTVVGTMFSALTVNLRLRELMLPTLVYPIMIPGLLGAIQLTSALVMGHPIDADLTQWLKLLAGFDIIYTALATMLVDTVLVG